MKNILVGPILIFIYYLCLSVVISHCTNMKLKYAYLFINSNNSYPSTIDLLVKMIILFHINYTNVYHIIFLSNRHCQEMTPLFDLFIVAICLKLRIS